MTNEIESIPKDLDGIRNWLLNAMKEINIEPEPLREILADIGLGLPLIGDLPECPDVSREFMIALGINLLAKQNLEELISTLRMVVVIFKPEEARQFDNFVDAFLRKHYTKLVLN